jgi:predicted GIY-YIG superfamily endonuclease
MTIPSLPLLYGKYYTGITKNLKKRLYEHPKRSWVKRSFELVFIEAFISWKEAKSLNKLRKSLRRMTG